LFLICKVLQSSVQFVRVPGSVDVRLFTFLLEVVW